MKKCKTNHVSIFKRMRKSVVFGTLLTASYHEREEKCPSNVNEVHRK